MTKFFTQLQYVVLALLIIGQCTVGEAFMIGQGVYLLANAISVTRCIVLKRPPADIVKDVCCLAITVGLMIFKIFV